MSNLFGHLLSTARTKKKEVIDDMTRDLLSKHPTLGRENVLVQEHDFVTGRYVIKVSLRVNGEEVDSQTATLVSSVETTIVREPTLPPHHPDYKKEETW